MILARHMLVCSPFDYPMNGKRRSPPPLSECLFFFGVFLSMLARAAGP